MNRYRPIMTSAAICIPCFNAAPFLPDLARSIAQQTHRFDEVILCDDASTDGSAEVAERLGVFTTIIKGRENRGPGPARNECLARVTADWVHFQDADDLLVPDFLATTLRASGDVDVVLVSAPSTNGGGFTYLELNHAPDAVEYCLSHIIGGTFGLYRKTVLDRCGGFSADLAGLGNEDPDLHVRLAASGARFRGLPDELIINRPAATSFSARRWDLCQRGALVCARRYFVELPDRYHSAVLRMLTVVARECDNKGFLDTADEAWALAASRGVPVALPSRFGVVRHLGRMLGADVASALRVGRVRRAARRLARRIGIGP